MKEKDNSRDADYEEDDDEDFSCEETSTETMLVSPPQLKLPPPLIIDLFLVTCIKYKTKMCEFEQTTTNPFGALPHPQNLGLLPVWTEGRDCYKLRLVS